MLHGQLVEAPCVFGPWLPALDLPEPPPPSRPGAQQAVPQHGAFLMAFSIMVALPSYVGQGLGPQEQTGADLHALQIMIASLFAPCR